MHVRRATLLGWNILLEYLKSSSSLLEHSPRKALKARLELELELQIDHEVNKGKGIEKLRTCCCLSISFMHGLASAIETLSSS